MARRWMLPLVGMLAAGGLTLRPAPLAAQTDQVGLPVGTAVSPVVVQDLNGDSVDLGRYIGKQPVLIEFWATWCPRCKALEPRMRAAYREFHDHVAFLAISVAVNESPRSIKRHLANDSLPYPVLWDLDGNATRAYAAPTTSYMILLDKSGKVVYTGVGEDQPFEAALKRVTGGAS